MKKTITAALVLRSITVLVTLYAWKETFPDGRTAKAGRDVCHRKFGVEMDRCVDKDVMSRVKCARQNYECMESRKKMLK